MAGPLTIQAFPVPGVAAAPGLAANRPAPGHAPGHGWGEKGPVIGSLCTGYGGLDLAVLAVLGGRIGWCADPDRHVRVITRTRLPGVVNLGDITALDWAAVPAVDVISAGFPCQDLSPAGKGAGITEGTRSGIWLNVLAGIRTLRPALVFVENVAALRWRRPGLDRVLAGLAEAGYDACWRSVRASDIGAPHRRERIFLLAHRTTQLRLRDAAAAHPAGRGQPPGMPTGAPASAGAPGPAHRRADHLRLIPAEAGDEPGCSQLAAAHLPEADGGEAGRLVDWGEYTPAVRRWEAVLGRAAPPPTEPTSRGRLGASARFVEWMMGLPAGWVTDVPVPRRAQLHALGNGVVPAQAAHALRLLIDDHTAGVHNAVHNVVSLVADPRLHPKAAPERKGMAA